MATGHVQKEERAGQVGFGASGGPFSFSHPFLLLYQQVMPPSLTQKVKKTTEGIYRDGWILCACVDGKGYKAALVWNLISKGLSRMIHVSLSPPPLSLSSVCV